MTAEMSRAAREREEAMSVALQQPHRRPAINSLGGVAAQPDDRRLGYALGRLCAHYKPMPLGEHLEQAGNDYANLYRRAMAYLGLTRHIVVEGLAPGEILSDAKLRERKELELRRLKEAESTLIRIDQRLKSRMHALCVLDRDASVNHIEMIKDGLIALDCHFRAERRA